MPTTTTTEYPTTAPHAAQRGFLVARQNYDGKMEQNRYRRHCRNRGQLAVIVSPRRDYASITVELPAADLELSPGLALLALRTQRQHNTPGRVRLDGLHLDKLPIDAAVALAREIVAMVKM